MRDSWDTTWQNIALAISRRSRCVRRQVGAVVVTERNRIVAVGYNGPPAGLQLRGSCDHWCDRSAATDPSPTYANCLSIHAEANALLVCDRRDRENGTMYVTSPVCLECAKLIANSGLAVVKWRNEHASAHRLPEYGIELMRRSGLKVLPWTT